MNLCGYFPHVKNIQQLLRIIKHLTTKENDSTKKKNCIIS